MMGVWLVLFTKFNSNLTQNTVRVLISNFRLVLKVLCFLLGNSVAAEFYMPTFRNTLFHLRRQVDMNSETWELPTRKHRTLSVSLRIMRVVGEGVEC